MKKNLKWVKKINLFSKYDISIPFHSGFGQVNAFYAPPVRITPYKSGDFIGATKLGGSVNFMNLQLNPHGNGTHTECIGHITQETYNVNDCINDDFYLAELISVYPELTEDGDKIISRHHLSSMIIGQYEDEKPDALIIRTLDNSEDKKSRNYSGTNPIYIQEDAIHFLNEIGIIHLLVDIPSVDREEDGGKLLAHKAFWGIDKSEIFSHKSITELIYVANEIPDGFYGLKLNIANITLDAAPSRPFLYDLIL